MSAVITSDPDYWGISWSGWGDVERGRTSAHLYEFEVHIQIKLAGCGDVFPTTTKKSVRLMCLTS